MLNFHQNGNNRSSGALTTDIPSSFVPASALDASPTLNKSSNANSVQVTSPKAHVGGESQSKWADNWWKYVLETPVDSNPLTSDKPFPQFGNVQFLAGVSGGGTANRSITISTGTHLYAPLANQEVDRVGFDSAWSEQDSRDVAKAIIDTVSGQFFNLVSAQGETSLVSNWKNYRQSSDPGGFTYNTSATEKVTNAVQDGYYVMLNPLSPGNYTFHFGATFDFSKLIVDQNHDGIDGDTLGEKLLQDLLTYYTTSGIDPIVVQDITYNVTVAPQSKLPGAKVNLSALA